MKSKINKSKPVAKVTMESTIVVVSHGVHKDAISIDGDSPLAYPFWKYKETDREHYVGKYERMFWSRIDMGYEDFIGELNKLLDHWKEHGVLRLAHDKPHLPNHSDVIRQYLVWQARTLKLSIPGVTA